MHFGKASKYVQDDWYLAQLKPGGYERAATNLARQGFASFMPQREVTRRRAGRWEARRIPLFPGYLFVRVSENKRQWSTLNATYGVSRLVSLEAGRPTVVAPELIEALQSRTSSNGLFTDSADLQVGDKVRVVSGPLADMLAEIEAIPEQGRIFVLLDLMGRYTQTELAAADVEPT